MASHESIMPFLTQNCHYRKLKIAHNFNLSRVWLMIFLFWHWGFLQGFFWNIDVKLHKMLVIRCQREYCDIIKKYLCIYGVINCAKLTLKVKEFEQIICEINDDILFLDANGIDNSNELRAKANMSKVCEIRSKFGNINEVQKIYPILLITDALPSIGIDEDDYLFLDIQKADFDDSTFIYNERDILNNIQYVRDITQFLTEHYEIVLNQIERENQQPDRDKVSDTFALEILASVVAYALVGDNFSSEFNDVRAVLLRTISFYREIWDIGINFGDLAEVFKVQAEQGLSELLPTALPRKKLSDLEVANKPNVVLYDEFYYYFTSETAKKCLRGELTYIPFVRILHQLHENGYLKVTGKRSRDFTTVVNLIQEETGKIKQKRLLGIKRQFFE